VIWLDAADIVEDNLEWPEAVYCITRSRWWMQLAACTRPSAPPSYEMPRHNFPTPQHCCDIDAWIVQTGRTVRPIAHHCNSEWKMNHKSLQDKVW